MRAMLIRRGRAVARFTAAAAVPAVLLLVLAIACGMVRTAALGLFMVLAGLRVLMHGLARVGAALPVPAPQLGGEPA